MTTGKNLERQWLPLLSNDALGNSAKLLRFRRPWEFEPGMVIGLSSNEVDQERWYSIASGTAEPFCEILYTLVSDGLITPKLWPLSAGDRLLVSPPRGWFRDGPTGRVWWVANGTGVAPFMSMAKSGLAGHRILLHGCRTGDQAFGAAGFAEDSVVRYIPCLSGETKSNLPQAWFGRLTDWLRSFGPAQIEPADSFRLCGSAGMIVEVREILIGLGVPHEKVESEIYF